MPADLVLVVDDDAAVRQVTVEMARDLGCEVAQVALLVCRIECPVALAGERSV